VWYRLDEVMLLCLIAVLPVAESWVEIAELGKKNLERVGKASRGVLRRGS
jgi:hypothetical protein